MALAPHTQARWLDAESSDLIRSFWKEAGGEEPFPRTLESALAMALPVTLVRLARLHLEDAEYWLRARRIRLAFGDPAAGVRRPVHGCIIAQRGNGILFVDGADSPAEVRFTIAHEVGHFLADHHLPRRRALAHFGPTILDVLDGARRPTVAERLSSVVCDIPLDTYTNFLPRGAGLDGGLDLWRLESRADRIGAALLAPPDAVLAAAQGTSHSQRERSAVDALVDHFGFPASAAHHYAQSLLAENGRTPSWADALRRPPGR